MKFLKKINIGLVLAIITIMIVVIYCINIESSRKSDKQDIKRICEEFIDLTDKYSKLPGDQQNAILTSNDVRSLNLDNYYMEIENVLKKKMKNDTTVNIQKNVLVDKLKSQLYDPSKVIIDVNKEITKISSYSFYGDSVTVTFNSKLKVKKKYLEINEETSESTEKINESAIECNGESIVLEKIDGTWKVVYANLQYSTEGDIGGGVIVG